MVPCPFICYAIDRLFKDFCDLSPRKYVRTVEEVAEGLPGQLLKPSDTLALFQVVMNRITPSSTRDKVEYWRDNIMGKSVADMFKEQEEAQLGSSASKRSREQSQVPGKIRDLVPPHGKQRRTQVPGDGADVSEVDEEEESGGGAQVLKNPVTSTLYCAPYLLEHFKFGSHKCTTSGCRLAHTVPPTKTQVSKFMTQLQSAHIADMDKWMLKNALGAR